MQRSLSTERNGIPLCFTMFGIRLWYPVITEIKYGLKDLKYIKLCCKTVLATRCSVVDRLLSAKLMMMAIYSHMQMNVAISKHHIAFSKNNATCFD